MKKPGKMKRRIGIPVAAGFITIFLLTMGLTTYLVKERYAEQYAQSFREIAYFFYNTAAEKETDEKLSKEEWGAKQRKDFYQRLVNEYFQSTGNQALQVSAAVYDEEGKLWARSCGTIGDTH